MQHGRPPDIRVGSQWEDTFRDIRAEDNSESRAPGALPWANLVTLGQVGTSEIRFRRFNRNFLKIQGYVQSEAN